MNSLAFGDRSIQVGVQLTPRALFAAAGFFAVAGTALWLLSRR
jgi:hypothetical protein